MSPGSHAGPRRFLTTQESADRLGVSVNTVKAWIRRGELPAIRTPGGHHRIADDDLAAFEAWLSRRGSKASPGARRVLIVEDDEDFAGTLREALRAAMPEARVDVATDGYQALVQVGASRPDVLVLDLLIPEINGFEVCRRLKASPETAGIHILAMTGHPEGDVPERILGAGADDFLAKPFGTDEFRARVVQLLAARGGR